MPEYIGLKTRVEVGKAYALDGFGAFHFEPYQGNGENCDDCAFKDVDFPCERFACDSAERDDGLDLYAVKVPGDTVPDGVERVELETRKNLSPFVSDTQVSLGSAGDYQADERADVAGLSWRVSGR